MVKAKAKPKAKAKATDELTVKETAFVREYLIDLNATQAMIRAGYSARSAGVQAVEIMAKPRVKAALESAMAARAEKTGLTAERVLQEIQTMAFYDPADLVAIMRELGPDDEPDENDGIVEVGGRRYVLEGIHGPLAIRKLPEGIRRAIVGWGYDRNQNFTIKLADKSKALDQLARHLSLYKDTLEVGGLSALADRLERAHKRAG